MRLRNLFLFALISAMSANLTAQDPWIHVYCIDKTNIDKDDPNNFGGTGQFYSVPLSEVDSTRFSKSSSTATRFNRFRLNSTSHKYNIAMSNIKYIKIGPNVPTIRINITDDPTLKEVESKEEYLSATLSVDGAGIFEDFDENIQIRGRGNSTWGYPKKAYRLKLPSKASICGFRKAKNYVLLANYIDPSMMRSAVASMAAQYVGMPYPTHSQPVDVYFNNIYKGSYTLTEKVGINNGSVDIPSADEPNSILFELDTNYDEDLRDCSQHFLLPVNIKDPDAPEDADAAKTWLKDWMADFNEMENAVKLGSDISEYIDYDDLARFLLVFNLAANQELNHPKSIFLYKVKGDKYHFGPCWDFDWAYGYSPTYRRAEPGSQIDEETAQQMIADIKQYIADNGIRQFEYFEYNGEYYVWFGDNIFAHEQPDGSMNFNWPYGSIKYMPSYENFLLGHGSNNQNTEYGMGNGGEFFMSIIMDNPEFMEVYKSVWEDFKTRLPEFWADFEAYAASLEPTAARNSTVWANAYSAVVDHEFAADFDETTAGAIQILRTWLEKRLEIMDREDLNFGLYDPNTTYVRGTVHGMK